MKNDGNMSTDKGTVPLQDYPFSARELTRFVADHHLYGLGSRNERACRDYLNDLVRDDNIREKHGREHDAWGRDPVFHPTHRTLLFLRKEAGCHEDDALKVKSKKARLDALLTEIYAEKLLGHGGRQAGESASVASYRVLRMFYDRVYLALLHYCDTRGWVYGRDVLLVSEGECVDCLRRAVKMKTENLWPQHDYRIILRDPNPKTLSEVEVFVAQALRVLVDGMCSLPEDYAWTEREASYVLDRVKKEIDGDVCTMEHGEIVDTQAEKRKGHSDTVSWNMRPDYHPFEFEGTVFKNVEELVVRRNRASDNSAETGRYRHRSLPLYISCSKTDPGGSVRFKIKYDTVLHFTRTEEKKEIDPYHYNKYNSSVSPVETSSFLRASADVIRVTITGVETGPARIRDLEMTRYVTLDDVLVPTPETSFYRCAEAFFGWNACPTVTVLSSTWDAASRATLEDVRKRALRLVWTGVALYMGAMKSCAEYVVVTSSGESDILCLHGAEMDAEDLLHKWAAHYLRKLRSACGKSRVFLEEAIDNRDIGHGFSFGSESEDDTNAANFSLTPMGRVFSWLWSAIVTSVNTRRMNYAIRPAAFRAEVLVDALDYAVDIVLDNIDKVVA